MDKSGTRTNGATSGSRASNWNNYPWNSNWNIGLRAACDDKFIPCRMVKATDTDYCCFMVSHVTLLWQIHYGVKVTSSRKPRKTNLQLMGKKYKNLIEEIASTPNLYRAYEQAAKGKRYSCGHLQFKQHLAANLRMLSAALKDGTYRPSPPNVFFVNEPKRREISALPFADRVVQHALCNVIEPIFDRTFLPNSYACRANKGTHAAARAAQAKMRKGFTWWLKLDFSKYFASVDRVTLHAEIRRKVNCRATLELIETFLPSTGRGLPIGNLTSQLFANVYGHILDRYLTHTLRIKSWLRYMDDTVIFGHSREALAVLQHGLKWFASASMGMAFSRWSIGPIKRGLDWLGYRVWPTHKLLRRRSVIAAKRKIERYTRHDETLRLQNFLASWRGHARWAETFNLMNRLGVSA